MREGVKRERLPQGPGSAEADADAQAKLLEFTQRLEVLQKELAELEAIIKEGIKLEPAGGAYDSANEELARAMDRQYKSLIEMKKSELQLLNTQLENLKGPK